jgi:hypothetical protein
MVACIARFRRRDAKYMKPPMMSRNGKNNTKLSMTVSLPSPQVATMAATTG